MGAREPIDRNSRLWDELYKNPTIDGERVESVPGGIGANDFLIQALRGRFNDRSKGRALEVGCGPGYQLGVLMDLFPGIEWWGVDIAPSAIAQARERLPRARLHVAHFADLGALGTATFDAILVPYCYQWNTFDSARSVMGQFARHLGGDGMLALIVRSTSRSVPEAAEIVPDRGLTFLSPLPHEDGGPIHHFTLDELSDICAEHALRIADAHEVRETRDRGEPYLLKPGHAHLVEGLERAWWQCVIKRR
jgi:SAM-dependent methyltransferase